MSSALSSVRHPFVLKLFKSNQVVLSAFCTGVIRHGQDNTPMKNAPERCKSLKMNHPARKAVHTKVPGLFRSENSCLQEKQKIFDCRQESLSSNRVPTSSSINYEDHKNVKLKPASGILSLQHKAMMSASSFSFFKQPCAQYHQTSINHTPLRHWQKNQTLSQGASSGKNGLHHPLLRHQDGSQTSHHSMSSFSPTKTILNLSPHSLQPYLRLIRFDKPIGTWLLFWPCAWSIALAAEPGCFPDLKILTLFGAGAFFMRGAGCIINDMWDKDFDAKVERTKQRPLASGEITQFQALVFLGTQLTCALSILLQLNNYSIVLGAASMGLVVMYPLAKRFTYWPQIILGLTLNWGVLLGWSALHGYVELPGLLLYGACVLYTVVLDTVYSHQDKYDDMLIGVKSAAIKLGEKTKPWMTTFSAVMAGGLVSSGYLCDMTWPYYAAVGLSWARLTQLVLTTDLDNPENCSKTFHGSFHIGAIMFAGIVLANYLKAKEKEKNDEEEKSQKELFEEELKTDKKEKFIAL